MSKTLIVSGIFNQLSWNQKFNQSFPFEHGIITTYFNTATIAIKLEYSEIVLFLIEVTENFSEWIQKGILRVSWPFATSLFRNNNKCILIIYDIQKRSYTKMDVAKDSEIALFLNSNKICVISPSNGFYILQTDPNQNLDTKNNPMKPKIPIINTILPNLCTSTEKYVLLISLTEIQLWAYSLTSNGMFNFLI